jgi:hypothetical protein
MVATVPPALLLHSADSDAVRRAQRYRLREKREWTERPPIAPLGGTLATAAGDGSEL